MEGYNQNEIYSEKEKDTEEYLVGAIDAAIAELVQEKRYLRKAYNYYNGVRDAQQFRHLEENYGIGTPTAVEFIPLIRRHVDALVGQYLQNKIKPKVTCKDKPTLLKIERAKQLAIYEGEVNRLRTQFLTNFDFAYAPKDPNNPQQAPLDVAVESELEQLKEDIAKNFVSEFEIAAQNILLHLSQSKSIDLAEKLKTLMIDLLVAGQHFFKVHTIRKGETPKLEVINPYDAFIDRPYTGGMGNDGGTVNKSPRSVIRRWYYKDEILNRYGHHLTKDDIESLSDVAHDDYYNNVLYVRGDSATGQRGLIADTGIAIDPFSIFNPENRHIRQLIPVYEVEWITTNKFKDEDGTIYFRQDRYKGVRISGHIYVDMGKDESAIRSIESPYECETSLRGAYYSDRNGNPYSLVLACANLQDRYDLLHFHMQLQFAHSGVAGDWIDVSNLPPWLGPTPEERLMKFLAYKKQGMALISTADDGTRGANHNTIFNGYDDTVKAPTIQAYQLAIQQTEETCSAITGVFRELLGGIEQRDAVTNVEVGVKTSAVITKQYFQAMDSSTKLLLIDAVNHCKESYRNGFVGSLILGDKMQKIFQISPENFSFTDYDVHIAESGEIEQEMQKIDALTVELVKGGVVDMEVIIESIGTESLTEYKTSMISAIKKKKAEMNEVQQLQQQVQQAQEQLQKLSQQAQQLQMENQTLKNKGMQLEEKAIDYDYAIRSQANQNTKDFNDKKIDLDTKRIELEKLQLFDDNPNNNEIKND